MFKQDKPDIVRPFAKEEHTNDGHFYRTDEGKLYPSITTIFRLLDPKDWYDGWVSYIMKSHNLDRENAEKKCNEIGQSSMNVGTAMHKLAEDYLNNSDDVSVSDLKQYEANPFDLIKPLKKWLDENIDTVNATEQKLYSDELELAGTVDLVATLKTGEKVIIDFKNSRKPKTPGKIKDAHYYEQMVAYAKMWEWCTKEKIETGIVLVVSWTDNKGDFKPNVRAFKCKLSDHESNLWDWILKYEYYKALNTT